MVLPVVPPVAPVAPTGEVPIVPNLPNSAISGAHNALFTVSEEIAFATTIVTTDTVDCATVDTT